MFEHNNPIVVEYGEFPIGVYYLGYDQYTASLMLCPHQACMTVAKGDHYVCPCHGSRFSARGELQKAPATRDLQCFTTSTDYQAVYIHLDSEV